MKNSEIRVIEWTASGYEGGFTQYALTWDDENPKATLWITQIATKNNLSRSLMGDPVCIRVSVTGMRAYVDNLIQSRIEDGAAKEVLA